MGNAITIEVHLQRKLEVEGMDEALPSPNNWVERGY